MPLQMEQNPMQCRNPVPAFPMLQQAGNSRHTHKTNDNATAVMLNARAEIM